MYSNSASDKLLNSLSSTPNLFQQLVLGELTSFQSKALETSVTPTNSEATNSYYINPETSAALVPTSPEMQSFKDILTNRRTFSWQKYDKLFNNVTRKILTLAKPFTFEEAIIEIDKFRLKAGPHFYGAILRRGDKLINPYHCLTPFSYAKHPDQFAGTYTVLLFFYSNRAQAESALGSSIKSAETKQYLDTLINNIIKCSNHKVEVSTPNNIESFFTMPSPVRLTDTLLANFRGQFPELHVLSASEIPKSEFDKIDLLRSQSLDSGRYEYLLVPHQVMVNGIFAPEYGVSLLRKTNSTLQGTFLTPSASCNINPDSLNSSLTWASVCTGRESQRTFLGISSLHCSNYASAYNSSAHSNGSIPLADISVEKSVEVYRKLGLLPVILPDTPSQEELDKLNDFIEYIDYMTTKFKLSMIDIETRYNTIKGQTNGEKEKQTQGTSDDS